MALFLLLRLPELLRIRLYERARGPWYRQVMALQAFKAGSCEPTSVFEMTRTIFSIFVLSCLMSAQDLQLVAPQPQVGAASGAQTDEKSRCVVEGRVVAASTGAALKKAIVM